MVAVLALGTQNGDEDITRSCLALSKWNPVSADAPHCREKSLARNSLAEMGAVATGGGEVVG